MNIYITLDYELFFAKESGSVEKSIIEPTQKIIDVVDPLGIKLCFFVDSGYLVNLKKYKDQYPRFLSIGEQPPEDTTYLPP